MDPPPPPRRAFARSLQPLDELRRRDPPAGPSPEPARCGATGGTGGISGLTLGGVDISSSGLAGGRVMNSYPDLYLVASAPVGAPLALDATVAFSSGATTGQIFRVDNPNAGAMTGAVAANPGSRTPAPPAGIAAPNDASLLVGALHAPTGNQITGRIGGSLLPDEARGYAVALADEHRRSSLFIGAGGITARSDESMPHVVVEIEPRSAPAVDPDWLEAALKAHEGPPRPRCLRPAGPKPIRPRTSLKNRQYPWRASFGRRRIINARRKA